MAEHGKGSYSESYKAAGVDITAGYRAVELMKQYVARTITPGVLGGVGGFGGMIALDAEDAASPILVAGTDGVGTKLKLAFLLDRHDTVGIDCVAMCVNDIVCCGARPLLFLDYIACGKNVPEKIAAIVSGVAEGCVQAGAALLGGETAEMPGFYAADEYDLAGFAVGVVKREELLDSHEMAVGDVVIALPSSGVHSNGFSLVRKALQIEDASFNRYYAELGAEIGEVLLTPTRIYVRAVQSLLGRVRLRGAAHITGGGLYENLPRALAPGFALRIEKRAIQTPPIFAIIAQAGQVAERDMYNTFNMGVGMCLYVAKEDADTAMALLRAAGESPYLIGEVIAGDGEVQLC